MTLPAAIPREVLAHWPALRGDTAAPFGTGLINETFRVEGDRGAYVVQRLHPIFGAALHHDIAAVTDHLARKGMLTPTLLPTADGALWVEHTDDTTTTPAIWRALDLIPDSHTWDRVPSPDVAREAGALVGRFHRALADLDHAYRFARAGVHDTPKHLATLAGALDAHRGHALYAQVAPLADEILAEGRALPDFSALPRRHGHGDLKVSNLLFDARDRGLCLVDLDTLGRICLAHEIGDALRSWCNPAGEDETHVALDVARFTAATRGYLDAAGDSITDDERASLVPGLLAVCLELSARFLADALREQYFGWNPSRFASRGAHNLARASGQWALYRSARSQRGDLERVTAGR